MRKLLALILIAGIGWAAYWWVGAAAKHTALENWLEERRQAGWVAEYSELKVRGFPNRFDTRFRDILLADLRSNWAWSADEVQILALSYKPNHVIVAWPPEHILSSPEEGITIASSLMRASVQFEPDTALALDQSTLEIDDLILTSNQGWESRMDKAIFATRQTEGEQFAHDIAFKADNWAPAEKLKGKIDPKNILPEVFETVHVDIVTAFDAPWDRAAVEGATPKMQRLDVKLFKAKWGKLNLEATGSLAIDGAGYPVGKLAVRAENWRDMLDAAVAAEAMNKSLAKTIEQGLELLSRLSGNKNTLDVPLVFKDRKVKLGPISLGDAPLIWEANQR